VALSTAGVLLTAILVGGFATTLLGFSVIEGLLLGAIVSSTDAAAVFSLLRSRNVSLRPPLKPLLELESGSNDPMAVFLTVGLIELHMTANASLLGLLALFAQQMILGGTLGYAVGRLMVYTLNRARLEYSGLYPVLTLGLVMLGYGGTAAIGGNGFLAVYIAGIVLGNSRFIHRNSLLHFHDGLAWLMQITMFLVLGLLVFPSHLVPIAGTALLVAVFQVLLARPLATFITLLPFRLGLRENAMVAWVGLRGAVPIVLATFPLLAGVQNAETIFNVVFFTVLVSVLVQGTSIVPVAKALGVHTPLRQRREHPLALEHTEGLNTDLIELIIPPNAEVAGKPIVDLGLPAGSLITLISRNEQFFVPRGDTVIAEGDVVLVLTDNAIKPQVSAVLLKQRNA
jgi:cell volume regulation protein A